MKKLEARTGVEPVMEVLQTSALPLGYRAITNRLTTYSWRVHASSDTWLRANKILNRLRQPHSDRRHRTCEKPSPWGEGEISGAGDGSRTRDFDLGKVALYH